MNLCEAINSGKPFKRQFTTEYYTINPQMQIVREGVVIKNFSVIDVQSKDWEVKKTPNKYYCFVISRNSDFIETSGLFVSLEVCRSMAGSLECLEVDLWE